MYTNLSRQEATILAWDELSDSFDDNWAGFAYPPGSRSMEILRKKPLGSSLICDLYRHIPTDDEQRPIAVAEELRRVQFNATPMVHDYDPTAAVGVRSVGQCERRRFTKPTGAHTQTPPRDVRLTLTGDNAVTCRSCHTSVQNAPPEGPEAIVIATRATEYTEPQAQQPSTTADVQKIPQGRDGQPRKNPDGRTVRADGTITEGRRRRKGRQVTLGRAVWSMLAHVYALLHFTILITCYFLEDWCMELVTNMAESFTRRPRRQGRKQPPRLQLPTTRQGARHPWDPVVRPVVCVSVPECDQAVVELSVSDDDQLSVELEPDVPNLFPFDRGK